MRQVEYLLTRIRELSKNQDFSLTNGIQDDQILQYLNDAQDLMQSQLDVTHNDNRPFVIERTISVQANVEGYVVPGRLFYGKEIEQVEFSFDGQVTNYRRLS